MYKRMLRSVLAIGFSAVAVFGAVSAVGGDVGGTETTAGTIGRPDLGWDTTPHELGTASAASTHDLGWD
ncbi:MULTISPECIES: hypothetical protein [unclassified Streptomyces]|uniref:hypothetical protein n=1 Tax=unclassified Streptomyces TaxID=2593676 RepID=UPI000DC77C8C|nr:MULTISPECIES: hypothetical protein [unclassified Streptomyces]AWZ03645.1 hypothetical protein DRB89_02265 [Streptomyces sp. ICC4]AWZ11042.1 hypothetical protein DRB96_00370 [Streptomyces sp. ICC1]